MVTQSARSDDRRSAILRAALAVFLDHGVERSSIEEIRRRSGASVGSIYHHFDSKEGVAAALYLEALTAYQRHVLEALTSTDEAETGVRGVVIAHLAWIGSDTQMARYLFMDRGVDVREAARDQLLALNAAWTQSMLSWLRPRIDAGEIRDLPIEVILSLWIGPAQELSRNRLGRPRGRTADDFAGVLAESAWNSLRTTA